MPRECVTHHWACDCREAEFTAIKAERDVLRARIDGAPVVTMKQLGHGIKPGDYAVLWDWNETGKRVALVVLEDSNG